jgi:hypothetical protein
MWGSRFLETDYPMTTEEKTKLINIAARLKSLAKRHEDDDITECVTRIHEMIQPK